MGAGSGKEALSPKNKGKGTGKMGVKGKKPSLSPKRGEKHKENEAEMGAGSRNEALPPKNKGKGTGKMGARRKKPSLSPKRGEKHKENKAEIGARNRKEVLSSPKKSCWESNRTAKMIRHK